MSSIETGYYFSINIEIEGTIRSNVKKCMQCANSTRSTVGTLFASKIIGKEGDKRTRENMETD